MLVTFSEVPLGNRDLAMGAVTKLDSSIATGKVRAN